MNVLTRALVLTTALVAMTSCGQRKPEEPAKPKAAAAAPEFDADAKAKELAKIASDAYVYGYPLVTMEMTRRVTTNVARPEGLRAPMGEFVKARSYPPPSYRDVTTPNADTLYTIVWLDVSKEPWVLSFPDMKERYFLMPMLDGWTNVFTSPGTRTSGGGAQTIAVTGPGWQGALPAGVKEVKSPTGLVWVIGRIYSTGTPADLKQVHALQDKFTAAPLSAHGKPYTPPAGTANPKLDMKTPVRDQVNKLDAATYFGMLAALMKDNPPAAADAPAVAEMAKVGIVPGQPFDAAKLDPAVQTAINAAPQEGQRRIGAWGKLGVTVSDWKVQNGWLYSTKVGEYGTNYIQRAYVTLFGLGANLPQDAIYPNSRTDAQGQPYDGSNLYVMHFNKGELPPAEAFWSITMYDSESFFAPNPLNRYTLSSRDKFKMNADGSLDLYFSNTSPGKDKESNWLPAPKAPFILVLRLYEPRQKPPSIIDGSWKVPPVKKV